MKFEATHISEMLTGLPAVALFDANHSEVLSHLEICDQTSNTYQQPRWLVSCVNLSQAECDELKIGWVLTFFHFSVSQSI